MILSDVWSKSAGEVLTIFLIPFGGGIPAGVILAKTRGLEWPITAFLYFVSDLLLACAFEPLMHLFIRKAQHSPFLTQWTQQYRVMLAKTGFKFGSTTGPLALIMISLGVDPMTSRVASRIAGHGFLSGWALAIAGDMIFFGLIMASTLWLNNILGDGTLTALIIMAAMIGVPMLIDRWKKSRGAPAPGDSV